MFSEIFSAEALEDAWNIIQSQFLLSTWQTVYVTILSTFFAFVIGLPLGVLLVTGEEKEKNTWEHYGVEMRWNVPDYYKGIPIEFEPETDETE